MNIKTLIFALLLTIKISASDDFALKPFLQLDSDSSLNVTWKTPKPSLSWLKYGSNHIATVTEGLLSTDSLHSEKIDNLYKGQSFSYQVEIKPITKYKLYNVKFAPPISSPTYSAQMIPPPNQPVRVTIYNDLHNKTNLFQQFVKLNYDADLTLFNGDCLVDLKDEAQTIDMLNIFNTGSKASENPILYLRGNHETRGAYAPKLRLWINSLNDKFYGAFSAGPVRFIILDTGESKADDHPSCCGLTDFTAYHLQQAEFLKKEIKSSAFKKAKYRVLVHHVPMHFTIPRANFQPILKNAKIDLAINGHTHKPELLPAGTNNVPYPVMIGGGSSPDDATVMLLEADKESLKIQMKNVAGETIYSIKIKPRKKWFNIW